MPKVQEQRADEGNEGQLVTDQEIIAFDPFLDCDRDVDIRHRTVRIASVAKPHRCAIGDHLIHPGDRARHETAIVDGKWGGFYCCIPCLETKYVQS
jgi:hypothetical protein